MSISSIILWNKKLACIECLYLCILWVRFNQKKVLWASAIFSRVPRKSKITQYSHHPWTVPKIKTNFITYREKSIRKLSLIRYKVKYPFTKKKIINVSPFCWSNRNHSNFCVFFSFLFVVPAHFRLILIHFSSNSPSTQQGAASPSARIRGKFYGPLAFSHTYILLLSIF